PGGDLVDLGATADELELALLLELRGDGDRVDRLAALEEAARDVEDDAVRSPVEVGRLQVLAHGGDRGRGEQHRAQHRHLRIEVVRGNVGGLRPDRGHGCSVAGGDLSHGPIQAAAADGLNSWGSTSGCGNWK